MHSLIYSYIFIINSVSHFLDYVSIICHQKNLNYLPMYVSILWLLTRWWGSGCGNGSSWQLAAIWIWNKGTFSNWKGKPSIQNEIRTRIYNWGVLQKSQMWLKWHDNSSIVTSSIITINMSMLIVIWRKNVLLRFWSR